MGNVSQSTENYKTNLKINSVILLFIYIRHPKF